MRRVCILIAVFGLLVLGVRQVAGFVLRSKLAYGSLKVVEVRRGAFPECISRASMTVPGLQPQVEQGLGRITFFVGPDSPLARFDISAEERSATSIEVFALMGGEEPTAHQLNLAARVTDAVADAIAKGCTASQ